ncbi:MAG TPA: 2-C-methyl-D-erythritol 4-phosphate cytidylyltransferase, partial [Chloroflexota bacterium]|nr:2-C-methyl-D-erythritol 4-phosphate cytidylyltransferase [Chloroflexota bacterium]
MTSYSPLDLAIVLVAAGGSTRMGFPKLWTEIHGYPLLAYAIAAAIAAAPAELIVVVAPERLAATTALLTSSRTAALAQTPAHGGTAASSCRGRADAPARDAALPLPVPRVVPGGARRRDSVAAGLAASSAPWLAIHDAARALAPPDLFAIGLAAAQPSGAAIPGLPLKDTIKR